MKLNIMGVKVWGIYALMGGANMTHGWDINDTLNGWGIYDLMDEAFMVWMGGTVMTINKSNMLFLLEIKSLERVFKTWFPTKK